MADAFLPPGLSRAYTLAQYLDKMRQRLLVPAAVTARATKRAFHDALRRGKPITWRAAREAAARWNNLCGRT